MSINPRAVIFILFATTVGWCFGHPVPGLAVGLGMVVLADMLP